jgi:hypothetical protein
MPSKGQSYDFMAKLDADEEILLLFTKKDYAKGIQLLNELIFKKRCAPQRPIEGIILMERGNAKLTCKILSEYRVEMFVFLGSFDLPITIRTLQTASNRSGCSEKIEFNE